MKLSKRLRKWKANLTTQTPIEYMLMLRADVNGFADEVKALERENAELREQGARLFDKTLELGTENAKLRELAQEMYGFVKDVCELRPDVLMANNVPDWQVIDYRTPSERYAEKLRELGIEVGK